MAMKVGITREGAQTLRDFAEAMPYAVESLSQDTEKIRAVFESLADDLGDLESDFREILETCAKAVENAQKSIETMPADLKRTAQRIDDYLDSHPEIAG